MSGAHRVLDPVEAAKDGISRSRHLIASTLDDLSQHHSWLEGYHRAERQRAERLRRQEALRRLELRRQRATWAFRRFAMAAFAVARATAAFLLRHGRAFAVWAAPRVRVLARRSANALSSALSWSSRTAPLLAQEGLKVTEDGFEAAKKGFAWSVRASDAAGVVFRREASARFAVFSAHAAEATAPALKRTAIAWTRLRHRARAQVRILEAHLAGSVTRTAPRLVQEGLKATKDGFEATRKGFVRSVRASDAAGGVFRREASARFAVFRAQAAELAGPTQKRATVAWTRIRHRVLAHARLFEARLTCSVTRGALQAQQLFERYAPHQVTRTERALIVRPNTALVCIAPPRARLPAARIS